MLDTSLDLFSRNGFEGTTTKESALAAGVTEAIIFRHFPSKQSLYQAVLDDYHARGGFAECLAEWRGFMERNDDEGLIRSIIQRILESFRCEEKKHRILFYAALEGHEIGLEHNRQIALPVFDLLSQYVERRQKEGALAGYAPGAIIGAVAGMASHYGMMTRLFGFKTNLNEQAVVDDFTAIVLNGIRVKKIVKGKK